MRWSSTNSEPRGGGLGRPVEAGRRALLQGQQRPGVTDVVVPGLGLVLGPVVAVEEPPSSAWLVPIQSTPACAAARASSAVTVGHDSGVGGRDHHRQPTEPGQQPRAHPCPHRRPRANRDASEPYARRVVTNRGRWVVTVAVGLVVRRPGASCPDPADDFPISTYPMFTTERGEVVDIDTAVRVDEAGRHRLSPRDRRAGRARSSAPPSPSAGPSRGRRGADPAVRRDRRPGGRAGIDRDRDRAPRRRGPPPGRGGRAVEVTVHERCDGP